MLLERISTLRNAESNRLYYTDINASIERYKSMYYDRLLQDFELSAILKPSNFDVQSFYCEALVNCVKRLVEEQTNEISELKSENAKTKRRAKVIEKVNFAKVELQNKCSSTTFYLSALNSIDTLHSTLI